MPSPPVRLIAHLDMDAFYASVELLRYPELRGRPVVIGGGRRHQPVDTVDPATGRTTRTFATLRGYVGRGVITTATYEARALGLNSAMGLMKAVPKAPDAVLLPSDFDAYRKYSRLFKGAVSAIAPLIQDNGIDEIYIDLTDVHGVPVGKEVREPESDPWERVSGVAQSIKDAVRAATGLSCSIGIAPNKLLAKIASELDKPDGITVVRASDLQHRIWPLPARKINGIGPKSSARLEALGIHTIGDFGAADTASGGGGASCRTERASRHHEHRRERLSARRPGCGDAHQERRYRDVSGEGKRPSKLSVFQYGRKRTRCGTENQRRRLAARHETAGSSPEVLRCRGYARGAALFRAPVKRRRIGIERLARLRVEINHMPAAIKLELHAPGRVHRRHVVE